MKLELKPYQQEIFDFCKDREFFANNCEMGLGKTLIELARIHHLFTEGKITGVVWITPKSIMHDLYEHLDKSWPDETPIKVLLWKAVDTIKYAAEMDEMLVAGGPLKILVANTEAFSSARIEKTIKRFSAAHPGKLVVVDEASRIKERTSLRTKRILALFHRYPYRDIMTGSPVLNSPEDLWAPCHLLSPTALGPAVGRNFHSFRARYAELKRESIWVKGPRGPVQRAFNVVVGYRNLDELAERLKTFSVRLTSEEVLDLPPRRYEVRHVDLTDEQKRLAHGLEQDLYLMLQDGSEVKITNILAQMAKLHQVILGFIQDDTGGRHVLRSNRLTELRHVLDEVGGKVIIWASHHFSIELIKSFLEGTYGAGSTIDYYGLTPQDERATHLARFRDDPRCRFMVANPEVGGIGLTLTHACTCVYWNNTFSLEDRLQSEARIWRISQEKPVLYVDLIAKGTLDEKILAALKDKVDVSKSTLGDKKRLLDLIR
jgi:SNF2 family DNA or RNA helicase